MFHLNRYTSIQDIVQWEIKIPGSRVSFLYKRKPDGFEFFKCATQSPCYNTKRIFMSPDELLCICNHTEEWLTEYFKPSSALNWTETVISLCEETSDKQLTLAFYKHQNIISLEVRLWERNNETAVFEPTSFGFYISGLAQMKYMLEVRKRMLIQMKKTYVLSNYVTVIHYMLYQEYYAFKKTLIDDPTVIIDRFLSSIDVQKFIYLLRKQWQESIYAGDPECKYTMISERELFTYVLTECINETRNYIIDNDINDWHICKDLENFNIK